MQQPYPSVLRLVINKFMKTLKKAADNTLHGLTSSPVAKLLKRPSFHLTRIVAMYTGIPLDNRDLYNLKWLTRSTALERSSEATNTELSLAIKRLIAVCTTNPSLAHPIFCSKPNCN